MRDSVPNARYSSVCNVLRQWSISLIPTYRVGMIHVTVCKNHSIIQKLYSMCNASPKQAPSSISLSHTISLFIIINIIIPHKTIHNLMTNLYINDICLLLCVQTYAIILL